MAPARLGDAVKIRYVGTLDDGTVIESSQENFSVHNYAISAPVEITLGDGSRLEELENAIVGMEPNQEKLIRLEAADAYGTYNPNLVIPAKAGQVPPHVLPNIGESVDHVIQSDQDLAVKISRLSEEDVIIDANHPLIEKAINYKIIVVEILEHDESELD